MDQHDGSSASVVISSDATEAMFSRYRDKTPLIRKLNFVYVYNKYLILLVILERE